MGNKLEFDVEDIFCWSCGAERMARLRRLHCGHFIDHDCLKERVRKGKFHCEKCGAKFLKGYESLVREEEGIKRVGKDYERREERGKTERRRREPEI